MSAKPVMRRSGSARRRVLALLLLGPVVAVAGLMLANLRPSADRRLAEARQALQEQRYDDARLSARAALEIDPESEEAWLTAALAEEGLGEWPEAVACYPRIQGERADLAVEARRRAGDVLLLQLHDRSGAEREFRRVLELHPENKLAHDRLAYILGLATRDWEMIRVACRLLRKVPGKEPVNVLAAINGFSRAVLTFRSCRRSPSKRAFLLDFRAGQVQNQCSRSGQFSPDLFHGGCSLPPTEES
jgi:tetratricopeptide (TPR) repeat protein